MSYKNNEFDSTPFLQEASDCLYHNGVIAFPTDTVMGLGILYDDKIAYERLNRIKKRPESKPYTLMLSDTDQISLFAEIDERSKCIIDSCMPGPLTLLLPAKKKALPQWVTHGGDVVGIRVPAHRLTHELLSFVGKPLLVPSANISGMVPARNSAEVKLMFGDSIDYIIEGNSGGGVPSTILDLTGKKMVIVRDGPYKLSMFEYVTSKNREYFTIAVGSDHAGFYYKEDIIAYLKKEGHKIIDCGTDSFLSCDYPIFGEKVGLEVSSGRAHYGVLICSTGEGIAMAANKVNGIRCGIGYADEVASLLRRHNDANCIAFGSKFMDLNDVIRRINIFIYTHFEGERHKRRVDEIMNIGK